MTYENENIIPKTRFTLVVKQLEQYITCEIPCARLGTERGFHGKRKTLLGLAYYGRSRVESTLRAAPKNPPALTRSPSTRVSMHSQLHVCKVRLAPNPCSYPPAATTASWIDLLGAPYRDRGLNWMLINSALRCISLATK